MVFAVVCIALCGVLIVTQTLALRPKFKESTRFKVANLVITLVILAAFIGIAIVWAFAPGARI